ncbi:PIG-X-domain-containing protein [Periconia macrospinosa]|uniref:Protein PBN1 n=1 Tax=Periconia macrospinosa TaxID=97972 RepID=A0A2V1EAN0_9PLEO|nr:PIG-X-domain-containing protein [Periconia macrospinosa]
MKQRITYIVQDPDSFSPEQLVVKGSSLTLNRVQAAKEQRITVGLDELPSELKKAFEQWHELHIRWASSSPYPATPPFTSRVTPGLHVFFTPHKDQPEGDLCRLLHSVFGSELKCASMSEASTKMPILSERFSMSTTSQYYSHLESLSTLVGFIQHKVCKSKACRQAAEALLSAAYVDIDYDAISHALVLNAFGATGPTTGYWDETISFESEAHSTEVGVLTHEKNPDPEDIGFGGFLTVLGQDQAPKPTRFQTPTRHYPLSSAAANYKTSFAHPTGLHPTLSLAFPSSHLTPPDSTCKLHAYFTLPSYVFLDKYQFNDALYLASHNLKRLRSIAGATDLEAPDWVTSQWGSAALFELAIPKSSETQNAQPEWNVTIPLHLRYLPAADNSHTAVPVPWPVVFWACRAEQGTKMSVNPFDRLHLGYEALFGPKTRFMHIPPIGGGNGTGGLVEWINVPVLDLRKSQWVELGTIGTVIVAFLGLCWAIFGGGKGKAKKESAKQKKKQ